MRPSLSKVMEPMCPGDFGDLGDLGEDGELGLLGLTLGDAIFRYFCVRSKVGRVDEEGSGKLVSRLCFSDSKTTHGGQEAFLRRSCQDSSRFMQGLQM